MSVETDKLRKDNALLKQLLLEQQQVHAQQLVDNQKRLSAQQADIELLGNYWTPTNSKNYWTYMDAPIYVLCFLNYEKLESLMPYQIKP